MYKVGDKFILHSQNGKDYDIEIVNINPCRPIEDVYGVDIYCEGEYYGDVYFCDEFFLDKCQLIQDNKNIQNKKIGISSIPEIGISDEQVKLVALMQKYDISTGDFCSTEALIIDGHLYKHRYQPLPLKGLFKLKANSCIVCFEDDYGKHVLKVGKHFGDIK